jgi:hypothetical protein
LCYPRYDCGWRDCSSHGFASFHELLNHALASHLHANKVNTALQPSATTAHCLNLDVLFRSRRICRWLMQRHQSQGKKRSANGRVVTSRCCHLMLLNPSHSMDAQGDAISSLQEHLVAAHGDWCSQLPERVVVCRCVCFRCS